MIRRVITALAAIAAVTLAALLAPPGCSTGDCTGDCCAAWGESCNGECLPGQEICAARSVGGINPGRCACLMAPGGGIAADDAGALAFGDAGVADAADAQVAPDDLGAGDDGGVP